MYNVMFENKCVHRADGDRFIKETINISQRLVFLRNKITFCCFLFLGLPKFFTCH